MRFPGRSLLFSVAAAQTWNEQWRPQFHQSTPLMWGNDPNGMVFDGARYHLFYQHYPYASVHGPMHWGHSTSMDLLTWEHHEIAIVPVGLRDLGAVTVTDWDGVTHDVPGHEWPKCGQAFSGSAIFDKDGAFGVGLDRIILMWTEHTEISEPVEFRRERQSMGWLGPDDGYTRVTFWDPETHGIQNDPASNLGYWDGDREQRPAQFEADIRDPKIVKFDTHTQLAIIANCDRMVIYSAPWGTTDQWTPRTAFGVNNGKKDGTDLDLSTHDPKCENRGRTEGIWGQRQGGVWECPDLVRMTVEGTDEELWVMIVSIGDNGGTDDGPNTGSATMYFVGRFDSEFNYIPVEAYDTYPKWVDYGPDSYAGVTYDNTQPPIFQAWMSNWLWAQNVPTDLVGGWRSGMGLPRELHLVNRGTETAPDYRLLNKFISLEALHDEDVQGKLMTVPGVGSSTSVPPTLGLEVTTEFKDIDLKAPGHFIVRLSATPPASDPSAEVEDYVEVGLYIDAAGGNQEFRVHRSSSFEWLAEEEESGARTGYDHYLRASTSRADRISPDSTDLKIHVVFDTASVEVLFDDGEVAMSSLSFAGDDLTLLSVVGSSGVGSVHYRGIQSTVYRHTTTTPYPTTTSPSTSSTTPTVTEPSTTSTTTPSPAVTCPVCRDDGVTSIIKGSLVAMMAAAGLYTMA